MSCVPNIPVLIASGPIDIAVSSCFSKTFISIGVTSWNHVSLSIVTIDVKATIPYTSSSWNVLRSACIPAPALVSEPAIVNTFFKAIIHSLPLISSVFIISCLSRTLNYYNFKMQINHHT